jgi:hypothetical protein
MGNTEQCLRTDRPRLFIFMKRYSEPDFPLSFELRGQKSQTIAEDISSFPRRVTLRGAVYLFLAAVLALLIGSASLFSINKNVIGLFHDDGIYAVLAKSISEGAGYQITSLPTVVNQTKYPFLYPYVLSWVWKFQPTFPENVWLLKAVNVGFLVAIFIVSYVFWCRRIEGRESEGLLFAVLVSINSAVFSFVDFTVSDIFLLLLSLCVLSICHHPEQPRSGLAGIAPLAAVIGFACLTRAAAFPLGIAGAIHLYQTKRYRDFALYLLLLMLFVLPWGIWMTTHSQQIESPLLRYYASYSSEPPAFLTVWFDPRGALEVVMGNLIYTFSSLDLILQTRMIPGLILFALVLMTTGMLVFFTTQTVFFRSYVLLYLALVLSWPFHPARYLIPLIPVLYFFLFRGVHAVEFYTPQIVASKPLKVFVRHITHGAIAVIVVLHLGWFFNYLFISDAYTSRIWYGARLPLSWNGFSETFDWIRKNTDESATLATVYDPMYYLYTGRKAIRPGLHNPQTYFYPYGYAVANIGSVNDIKSELRRLGVRFLVIDPLDGFVEGKAYLELFNNLLLSYKTQPQLVFVSSDLKHRIYVLAPE